MRGGRGVREECRNNFRIFGGGKREYDYSPPPYVTYANDSFVDECDISGNELFISDLLFLLSTLFPSLYVIVLQLKIFSYFRFTVAITYKPMKLLQISSTNGITIFLVLGNDSNKIYSQFYHCDV